MTIIHEQNDRALSLGEAERREGGLRTKGSFVKSSEPGKPLLTVITVVRNGAEQIERTILSVLEQTYSNIEYIIIDGASTDSTLDVLNKYDHQLAYWISQPDSGLYDAMNKGGDLATGDWINFMNAGDIFYQPDTVESVIINLDKNDDLVYGHCRMIYDQHFSVIWKAGSIADLWKGMIFRHQSLFTKASICKTLHFDTTFKISADYAFIFSCFRRKYRFRLIDLVISTVTLGGLSDVNLTYAIQENRRAVLGSVNTLKVKLYYFFLIYLTRFKSCVKMIIPRTVLRSLRTLRYC
jgi:glycosyltransferase involved in cell wall biosynthesis